MASVPVIFTTDWVQNDNTTNWLPFSSGGFSFEGSTEANEQLTLRTAGTISKLRVHVYQNNVSSTSTYKLRKNTSDASLTVSITGNTTGAFEDNTNTSTVSAGDKYNHQLAVPSVAGTRTVSIGSVRYLFAASSNTVNYYFIINGNNDTTSFHPFSGYSGTTTEANTQITSHKAGTLKNYMVNCAFNTYDTSITINTRKNGSDGNITVSIDADTTGVFEDTSNTDTVSDGDEINMELNEPAEASNGATLRHKIEFETTDNSTFLLAGSRQSQTIVADQYYGLSHGSFNWEDGFATEANVQTTVPIADKQLSNLFVYVSANTSTAATVSTRIDGVDGDCSVSISSGQTGVFEDTSNVDTFATDDLLNYYVNLTSGTSIQVSVIKIELEDAAGGTALSTAKPTVSAIIG